MTERNENESNDKELTANEEIEKELEKEQKGLVVVLSILKNERK